jgi:hypothetical protein
LHTGPSVVVIQIAPRAQWKSVHAIWKLVG